MCSLKGRQGLRHGLLAATVYPILNDALNSQVLTLCQFYGTVQTFHGDDQKDGCAVPLASLKIGGLSHVFPVHTLYGHPGVLLRLPILTVQVQRHIRIGIHITPPGNTGRYPPAIS